MDGRTIDNAQEIYYKVKYEKSDNEMKLINTEIFGVETYLYMIIDEVNFTARVSPRTKAKPEDVIKVALDTDKIHLFDKETERTILN